MGSHAKLLWVESEPTLTTKEHMLLLASQTETDMIVVGMHGRKGPKE